MEFLSLFLVCPASLFFDSPFLLSSIIALFPLSNEFVDKRGGGRLVGFIYPK